MKQRLVGASGLRVSHIGLGTSNWGMETPFSEASAIVKKFIASGGTLIDVSPAYSTGSPEEILGKIMQSQKCRSDVIISASAGVDHTLPIGRRVDCSRRSLIAQLDMTLQKLETDYLDLWSVGFWDERTPPQEVADTLDFAVRSGRVRYAGVRGYAGWQLAVACANAEQISSHSRPIVAVQDEYSLLVRRVEEELLPAAQYLGVGFFASVPLAQGVLTGKYTNMTSGDINGDFSQQNLRVQAYLDNRSRTIVDALNTAADGLGLSPAVTALTWVRDQPGVTSAIVGVRTRAQLTELLTAESLSLAVPIRKALEDISL